MRLIQYLDRKIYVRIGQVEWNEDPISLFVARSPASAMFPYFLESKYTRRLIGEDYEDFKKWAYTLKAMGAFDE